MNNSGTTKRSLHNVGRVHQMWRMLCYWCTSEDLKAVLFARAQSFHVPRAAHGFGSLGTLTCLAPEDSVCVLCRRGGGDLRKHGERVSVTRTP